MLLLASSAATLLAVDAPNPGSTRGYIRDNSDTLAAALQEHVILTVSAVVIGALLALPLAVLARRSATISASILSGSTILYTIPSLAMFAFLAPITGLEFQNRGDRASPLLPGDPGPKLLGRLAGVPAEVREAALGMGYGPARMLVQVEMPMALPTFFAGLRIATVSTVALATVGVIIGFGGLGNVLISGFNNNFFRGPIATAAVLCVVLALAFDLLLALSARLLTPWTRGRS
ncbi:MAG: ABC transporter permease subunit [Geodermatophilaceae bacterium]